MQRALAQLSRKDQELFQERYVQGRSVGEIAAALGIKYWAAAARLRRLKERVRGLMQSEEPPPRWAS